MSKKTDLPNGWSLSYEQRVKLKDFYDNRVPIKGASEVIGKPTSVVARYYFKLDIILN